MYVDADGVGCGRRGALLSPGWLGLSGCSGVGCGRRGALLSPGWLGLSGCSGVGYGRRGVFVVAWLRIFFIFCLRRGGGYMYS